MSTGADSDRIDAYVWRDQRRRDRRLDHVDPRHDDRQRRPGHARARAARPDRRDPVGGDRLHAGAGRGDPDHRLGGPALRRQARLHRLAGPVHRRLGAVRPGHLDDRADRVPRAPGRRRRHDPADRPADDGRCRRTQADGTRDEHRRRAGDARPDPRPHDRRPDPRQRQLALDLLRQPPDRRDRGDRRAARPAHDRPRSGRPPGLPGPGPDGDGTAAAHLRAGRDRGHRRLHRGQGVRPDHRRDRAGGRLRGARPARAATRCWICACIAGPPSRRPRSRCSAWAPRCSAA